MAASSLIKLTPAILSVAISFNPSSNFAFDFLVAGRILFQLLSRFLREEGTNNNPINQFDRPSLPSFLLLPSTFEAQYIPIRKSTPHWVPYLIEGICGKLSILLHFSGFGEQIYHKLHETRASSGNKSTFDNDFVNLDRGF